MTTKELAPHEVAIVWNTLLADGLPRTAAGFVQAAKAYIDFREVVTAGVQVGSIVVQAVDQSVMLVDDGLGKLG